MASPDQPSSAVLRSVAELVDSLLHRHALALAEPVAARFHTHEHGSTGIAVTVRLADPLRAGAARALLRDQFGDAGVDDFDVA